MLSNSQIKYINSLHTKKYRQKYQHFIAEGDKIVRELLLSSFKIHSVFAVKDWIDENSGLLGKSPYFEINEVGEAGLKKISLLTNPNRILAIIEIPHYAADKDSLENKLSLVLDGIQDPGNLGTIIRIADWFGIENLFCSPGCADAYQPKVVQAAMGSVFRVKIHEADLEELFSRYKDIPVLGAVLEGENIFETKLPSNGFILIGSESKGISPAVLPFIHKKITIPKQGKAESLNAAVAAGIICAVMTKKRY